MNIDDHYHELHPVLGQINRLVSGTETEHKIKGLVNCFPVDSFGFLNRRFNEVGYQLQIVPLDDPEVKP